MLGLTEGWLPVLAISTFNVADCSMRVALMAFPLIAKPSGLMHACVFTSNLTAAILVVVSCVLKWPDVVVLLFHVMLAISSSWQINLCFVGADSFAAARNAPAAVRERTGALMQGMILIGVMCGLAFSTIIATVRESAAA